MFNEQQHISSYTSISAFQRASIRTCGHLSTLKVQNSFERAFRLPPTIYVKHAWVLTVIKHAVCYLMGSGRGGGYKMGGGRQAKCYPYEKGWWRKFQPCIHILKRKGGGGGTHTFTLSSEWGGGGGAKCLGAAVFLFCSLPPCN